ncbi:MAG: CDP-diacylglycerol--serine O-phosphatidyltransferase [Ignavibacteriales bacterium]|nr:CDP-diacylglycerol--serine O-phosphatidyltransferase [Ignavibacteriales bacterium]MCF8306909.1 CDP-diacylglycerol--serine O-phosphatidyltransferase [Ignavibacteriales bacterium]MCF8438145.1 CDP-diacylglycerol--serine O-phosphatidyltransferase [Ignavibacteriales bacterium]
MLKNINSRAFLPNSFTALNAFFGFLSIIYASQHKFDHAVVMIVIAAICDALDGILARLVNSSSRFGVELDSLADVISFGAAPAFLIYSSYLSRFGWIGIFLSSLPLIFGAFRLAKFNIMLEELEVKKDFRGLPVPLSALTISSYVYTFSDNPAIIWRPDYMLIALIILTAYLNVSSIRYNSLPKPNSFTLHQNIGLSLGVIVLIIVTLFTQGNALFFFFLSVVLFGIFRHLFILIRDYNNISG